MAKQTFTNGKLIVNSVDLSAWVKSMTLTYSQDMVDITAMGGGTHTKAGGLLDWSLSVEFFQDYAAAAVDVTLFGLVGSSSSFAIEVRGNNATVSPTNPRYTSSAWLASYQPVGGSIGDALMAPVTFVPAAVLQRQTS